MTIMKFTSSTYVALSTAIMLSVAIVPEIQAQTTARMAKPVQAKPQVLQARKIDLSKLQQFCNPRLTSTSKRGRKTTYTCNSGPGGTSGSIQARPHVARADINCDYADGEGGLSWLGCTCTSNDEGNCNNFISNCVGGGDDVSGNSGGASCSPPSDP